MRSKSMVLTALVVVVILHAVLIVLDANDVLPRSVTNITDRVPYIILLGVTALILFKAYQVVRDGAEPVSEGDQTKPLQRIQATATKKMAPTRKASVAPQNVDTKPSLPRPVSAPARPKPHKKPMPAGPVTDLRSSKPSKRIPLSKPNSKKLIQ